VLAQVRDVRQRGRRERQDERDGGFGSHRRDERGRAA
jgi:hypothetical protein